jgi:hypothetical protein
MHQKDDCGYSPGGDAQFLFTRTIHDSSGIEPAAYKYEDVSPRTDCDKFPIPYT